VLLALFDLVALLPGNPVVTRASGFAVVVAVQALIIWRLWHRSGLAWFVWVLFSAGFAAGSVLTGDGSEEWVLALLLERNDQLDRLARLDERRPLAHASRAPCEGEQRERLERNPPRLV
jgi:hypothetical protein